MTKGLQIKWLDITASILVAVTVLSLVALSSPLAGASTRQANVRASVTVSSTCSMTATVNSAHNATMVNGMYSASSGSPYENGIGKTTLQTFCNDSGGYAIYAVGFTNYMVGNTVLHMDGIDSTFDIVTGTATDGTGAGGDVSNWAMKLTAVSGTYAPTIMNGYDTYSAVPSSYVKVARLNNTTDARGGIGSSVETTYAAYISNTQPAGTYVGQVKYVLVHPGSGAAPETYVMQEIANWKGSLLPGVEVTAVDNRDGKTYTVALMDDDSIWMTQNLDLEIGGLDSDNEQIVLTSNNTDLNDYQTSGGVTFADYSYENDVITWIPTQTNTGNNTLTGTPAYITTTGGTTVSGWSNNGGQAYMMDAGDTYSYQGTRYNSLALCEAANHTESQCNHYHVGNYYNWSASVAMSSINGYGYTANYTVMPNSICPKGWRLPNGLTNPSGTVVQSDFNQLLNTYEITNGTDLTGSVNVGWRNSTTSFNAMGEAPLYFARSGYVDGSSLYNFGGDGSYWSSTVGGGNGAYYLRYNSVALNPALMYYLYYGRSVRCMAR